MGKKLSLVYKTNRKLTFNFFHCINEHMKYITEDELLDIDDFILEKYDSLKDKPQILFQTITQDVLAKKIYSGNNKS